MRGSLLFLLVATLVSGCAYSPLQPQMTAHERTLLDRASLPTYQELLFTDTLRDLGHHINAGKRHKTIIVMVEPAPNVTGARDVPVQISREIEAALDLLAGPNFRVMPYDPHVRASLALSPLPKTPHFFIRAGITRFDKDLKRQATARELNLLVGGGKWATGFDVDADRSMTCSEVSTVFELVNLNTGLAEPGLSQANSVTVYRLDARNRAGFAIYGNGIEAEGRLTVHQGLHKGIRNLIEYSVLQIFSKLYGYTYWQTSTGGQHANVVSSMTKEFSGYSRAYQVRLIQQLLAGVYPHGLVSPENGARIYVPATGRMEWKTGIFIGMFCQEHNLKIGTGDLAGLYRHLLSMGG